MKQKNFLKIAMLFVFAIISNFSYGQGTETFTGITGNASSYLSRSWTGDDGSTWTATNARVSEDINGDAITLNDDKSNTYVQSGTISGGIGDITISTQRKFSGGSSVLSVFINDVKVGTVPVETVITTTTISNVNISGDIVIKLWNDTGGSSSGGADRVGIDDVTWTAFSGVVTPTVTFDTETSTVNETDADIVTTGIPITLSNYAADVTITPTVSASSTADIADYSIDLTPLTFTADRTLNIPLTIKDDADFIDETIIIDFTVNDGSTADLGTSQHTVTITDDEVAPSIGFDAATSSETETDATFNVLIPVTVSDYSGTQIDISIAASGTADVADFVLNTTSLSFTADGSQNVSLDINDDADTDSETVILTITQTSAVTGLVISEATHTVSITDDETPPLPTAGTVFITEVSNDKGGDYNAEFIELYNNSNETVSLATSKIIRVSSSNSSEYVFDFGTDESTANIDATIPPYGFIIIARAATRAEFDTDQGSTLAASVKYNGGNGNLYFGSSSRRWRLMTGGTANTDDGTLIDDTGATTGVTRIYRNIFTTTNTDDNDENGTPGELEYLVYSGGAWVNGVAIDETTSAKDAYFYDDFTLANNSSINNIGISSGKTLTIANEKSLIVSGTATGDVTYNRTLTYNADNSKAWYLVSSPVSGEIMTDMISNNTFATSGANIGFAPYDNSQADSNDRWSYFGSGATDALVNGKGYTAKLGAAGDISFTGTLNTEDVSIALSQGANNFNLVGNPYTAYINGNTFLTEEGITTTDITSATLWLWNQATDSYETKVASDNFKIAPGQAFFVEANSTNTVTFTEAMQSNEASDSFQKSTPKSEVKLTMNNGDASKYLKVYYIEGTTTGYDNGYDGELFGGVAQPFALYSHLISDSEGKNYQIQSLPNSDFETMVIPVGINAIAGKEITFTAAALNLPSNLKVFLEDRLTNTYTRLDEANATYKVTLDEALNGVGRFFLHTSAESTLSVEAVSLDNISIYNTNNSNLRIVGLSQGKASVKLFNILGKQVLNTTFTSNGLKDISLPNLATGVYIVQLETETGNLNKKITLE